VPVTFYRATTDLPAFTDYAMANRTYRYFTGKPLFAFGHGLSYTQFKYESVQLDRTEVKSNDVVHVKLELGNTGARDGDEVVQVYYRHVKSAVPQAQQALCGFQRVAVTHKESSQVDIEVPVREFRYWSTTARHYVVEPGDYEILVGAASDDIRAKLALRVTGP
jgi:beta-glucosidase